MRKFPLQAKLTISSPDDIYEQEADRVADLVMSLPGPAVQPKPTGADSIPPCGKEEELGLPTYPSVATITPLVQRQEHTLEEEEDREEEAGITIHAKMRAGQGAEISSDLESRINSLQGGGQPLPEAVRAFFEPRFGQDFGEVRVHTDVQSADLAQKLQAQACTMGLHIFFGPGHFAPYSEAGRRLLSHELVHVMQQQGRAVVARTPDAPQFTAAARTQLLSAIERKINQINQVLMRGYRWDFESYRNGIIEVGFYNMRFSLARRNLYLLDLRGYLEALRPRVRHNQVPDPATHPSGARNYVTSPFELQWLLS
ncbi:MAG: DUF4157 domain-containing protein, partial [Desulfobacca sp.]|nr:DUF4157 domain-containing protein [Desulfobacca sp.]